MVLKRNRLTCPSSTERSLKPWLKALAVHKKWICRRMNVASFFGVVVQAAGDMNGDSFADVVVGGIHPLSKSVLYFFSTGIQMASILHQAQTLLVRQ